MMGTLGVKICDPFIFTSVDKQIVQNRQVVNPQIEEAVII
jgi:hypothetical protein